MPKLFVHEPFGERRCERCHDAAGGNQVVGGVGLCVTCHPLGELLDGELVHAPVSRDRCAVCHVAHQSKIRGLLRAPMEVLCAKCHSPRPCAPSQAAPSGALDCGRCHVPHAGAAPARVRAGDAE